MIRKPEGQTLAPGRRSQFAEHIALRPHLDRVPAREGAIVHGKAVVMFGNGHDIFRSRLLKQGRPGVGIKVFRLEQGQKIFIAKGRLGAIRFQMVFVRKPSP